MQFQRPSTRLSSIILVNIQGVFSLSIFTCVIAALSLFDNSAQCQLINYRLSFCKSIIARNVRPDILPTLIRHPLFTCIYNMILCIFIKPQETRQDLCNRYLSH